MAGYHPPAMRTSVTIYPRIRDLLPAGVDRPALFPPVWTGGAWTSSFSKARPITKQRRNLLLPPSLLLAGLMLGACSVPAPYQPPSIPLPIPPGSAVQTQPAMPPGAVGEPEPLPAPVLREPTLGVPARALLDLAQRQIDGGNYAVAASSIERALRIEPDNPLLWLELGKLRQAEGNHVQAENMARKAISMAITAPRIQADAWRLIADSYRSRGRNSEAQEALLRAEGLR